MKKVLKIIILVSVIMVMCSMSNFTYATEEDGRFVDIPVPPSSSGRADFTSEEADEQSKTYEESKNDSQQNSEILGQNSILYKGTETTTQNVTEEKQEQQENVEEQPKDENYIDNIVEEENKIDNIEKTDNNSSNIKFILMGILVVILILIILKKSISKKNKEKRKRKWSKKFH